MVLISGFVNLAGKWNSEAIPFLDLLKAFRELLEALGSQQVCCDSLGAWGQCGAVGSVLPFDLSYCLRVSPQS